MGVTRAAFVAVAAGLVLLGAPGTAAADVVFDQADAQDLADTLADATKAQGVCYGWNVSIDDEYSGTEGGQSIGSNLGAGRSLDSAGTQCNRRVEFTAHIIYTSDSSESDDSATWSVNSLPSGPSTSDLDALELFDEDDLVGDDPDVAVDKAVNALPQLTADAGAAKQIPATEQTQPAPANAGNLTDSPGNDFLRDEGGTLLFGGILLIGGIAFAVHTIRNSRAPARLRPVRGGVHGGGGGGGEPPMQQWADEQQRYSPGGSVPPAYPPPRAEDRQAGPRVEPPTEPLQSQGAPAGASPADADLPERTQKIDPPGQSTSDSSTPGSSLGTDFSGTAADGPERTEKLDPGKPPGDTPQS